MQYNNNGTNELYLINNVSQSEWQDTQVDNFDQSVHFEPAIPQSNLAEIPALRAQSGRDKEKFNRRYRQVQQYINALFNEVSSRLLVLRIDLGYHQELAQSITAYEAMADLNHFMNNRRSNPRLFGDMVGYIRKTEWSEQKGMHFHLIIFYDGHKRQDDVYIAQSIGEYWQKITGNQGIYWNCNGNKADYERCGIGMIEYYDITKRNNLLEDVAKYLTKVEQQPPQYYSASGRDRLFAMGVMPKERMSNVGRPRLIKMSEI